MESRKLIPRKKSIEPTCIGYNLTERQKDILKLLQKNAILESKDNRSLFIKKGNISKKVTPSVFYGLVNNGLVHHQTKPPFNYVLSVSGKKIKV